MSDFERLNPWCIIRQRPNLQRLIVARCRRRVDAEAYLQIINRLIPHVKHTLVFDPTPEQEEKVELEEKRSL